ncbi:ABC transporter substrate-binding protein [Advenella kashmirensis]
MLILKNLSLGSLLTAGVISASLTHAADLRIGAVFALSGPSSIYGEVYSTGTNLAVQHANEDNILDGRLSISYEDGQATPQRSVIGMNKLVNVEKVPFAMVSFSGVSKAVSVISERSKTVTVNAGGGSAELANLGAYFWNVTPLTNVEVKAVLPYLVKERKLKRFALIYVDDPAGDAIRKVIEADLPGLGGELISSFSVPVSAQQFSSIAARVRQAKPDVVYIASYGAQQASMIKQLRDNGVKQQLVSYSGFTIPEINALAEARGAIYTTPSVSWQATDPVTTRFMKDYQAKYGKVPTFYSANYYNAVRLFTLLARDLQKKGKPVTGENLLAQRLETGTFDLVGGKFTFSENGTVTKPSMEVHEVDGKGGKLLTVVKTD